MSDPPPEWKYVSVKDLKRFYQNPARYLLRHRLGMYLEERDLTLQGDEPFSLDNLDRYALSNRLITKTLTGEGLDSYKTVARAQGILPPGTPGDLAFIRLVNEVEAFSTEIRPHVAECALPPVEVDVTVAGFRISGRIDDIWPSAMVTYHFAKDKARYHLACWIDHLLLNLARSEGYPLTSRLITMDKTWVLQPLEDATAIIETLLHLYWQGLKEPLRFFPEASQAFAERISKGGGVTEALKAARNVWEGSEFVPGRSSEGADPYLTLCFGEVDPFADPFNEIARLVFDPLMEQREKA